MDLATLLRILELVGTETPAFITLYNHVALAFSTDDQATLAAALAAANKAADNQHLAAQS